MFFIFTAALLMILVSGAGAYQKIAGSLEGQYSERTCLSYLAAKIRHYDCLEAVYVTDFQGINTLALAEEIDGEAYTTLLYYYDGYLWELFAAKDSGLAPQDGLAVLAVDGVGFEAIEDSLFKLTCREGQRSAELLISVQSGKKGGLS
ncbi:MAG: DUF4860 domain-containing protein [Peptococcaceae bacterium]|nr:DUF4860 domain-containing protein [Peptococcaceae bacterium]